MVAYSKENSKELEKDSGEASMAAGAIRMAAFLKKVSNLKDFDEVFIKFC